MKKGDIVVVIKEEHGWSSWIQSMNGIQQQIGVVVEQDNNYVGTEQLDYLEFIGLTRVSFPNMPYTPICYIPSYCLGEVT